MRRKIYKGVIAVCIGVLLAGCGSSGKENQKEPMAPDIVSEDQTESEKNVSLQQEPEQNGAESSQTKDQELKVSVKEVNGEDIRGIKVETSKDEQGGEIAVLKLDDENLIQIICNGDTSYHFYTIKNGGVNGDADVTRTEASLSDIKTEDSLNLTGMWEADVFYADTVDIVIVE